jgi:Family of unknown function (DUF6262)
MTGERRGDRAARVATLHTARLAVQQENHGKIRDAILRLEHARKPMTVAGVAREAGVARRTVYRSPHIEEIQALAQRTAGPSRPAARDMQSAASCERRLLQALDQVKTLKTRLQKAQTENAILQRQLDAAILRGRQR